MVKKIGSDSIVLITIKQAQELNTKYDSVVLEKNNIDLTFKEYTKKSSNRLQSMYDSYHIEKYQKETFKEQANQYKIEADKFKYYYIENKKIYERRETQYIKENRRHAIHYLVLCILVGVFATI
jgi:hypothetical protein